MRKSGQVYLQHLGKWAWIAAADLVFTMIGAVLDVTKLDAIPTEIWLGTLIVGVVVVSFVPFHRLRIGHDQLLDSLTMPITITPYQYGSQGFVEIANGGNVTDVNVSVDKFSGDARETVKATASIHLLRGQRHSEEILLVGHDKPRLVFDKYTAPEEGPAFGCLERSASTWSLHCPLRRDGIRYRSQDEHRAELSLVPSRGNTGPCAAGVQLYGQ